MRDPYLYDDIDILKNKFNIRDKDELNNAESDIVAIKLLNVDEAMEVKNFDFNHLMKIHKYLFGDIYSWAGTERIINIEKPERVLGEMSIDYCDYSIVKNSISKILDNMKKISWRNLDRDDLIINFSNKIAELWKIHPFREGNTRTIATFMAQFAESKGITLDRELLKKHSGYFRDSLVMASIGEYSESEHLVKILKDSINYNDEECENL